MNEQEIMRVNETDWRRRTGDGMINIKSTILAELEALRREHYENEEDAWYSCPKSKGGCGKDSNMMEDVCDCGADDHNARLEKLINLVMESL
jgi:hypothetical protein